MCQSRPSQYLSNIESALGVCLSLEKFHVYPQCSISLHEANEELLCARHLYPPPPQSVHTENCLTTVFAFIDATCPLTRLWFLLL